MSRVNYHQGELLSHIEIVNVYLDVSFSAPQHIVLPSWKTDTDLQNLADRLNVFLSDITTSTYMDILAEYSIGTPYTIGRGQYIGAYFLSSYNLVPSVVGDQMSPQLIVKEMDIQQVLLSAIQHGDLPRPTPNCCYFIFTPPGAVLYTDGEIAIGYHSSSQVEGPNWIANVYYASISHVNTRNFFDPKVPPTSNITPENFDSMTGTVSHELVEAVTNPSKAFDGWHTDEDHEKEIGDICMESPFTFHGYQVSSFWSNKQNRCISNCQVQIRLNQPPICLGGLIENELVEFSADVSCLSPVPLTYEWKWEEPSRMVPILIENNQQPHFSNRMPAAPNKVIVTVTVTDTEGHQASSTATFKAITQQEADKQTTFCEFWSRIQLFAEVNFLVDPLWDPLRDFTVYPIQGVDIYKMHQDAQQLAQLTGTLVGAYEATLRQGPV